MTRTRAGVRARRPKEPSGSEELVLTPTDGSSLHFFKQVPPVSRVCSVLASILRAWLDQCPEDFQEPPHYPCLHRLLDYLGKALPGSETLRRAEGLLEQLQTQAGVDDTEGNRIQRSTDDNNPFHLQCSSL